MSDSGLSLAVSSRQWVEHCWPLLNLLIRPSKQTLHSSGQILLTLQGDYEAPLKAGTRHVEVLRGTQSSLLGMQDLAVETQHQEHQLGESPQQQGILTAMRGWAGPSRDLGTRGSSGSQEVALPDAGGHTPNGF